MSILEKFKKSEDVLEERFILSIDGGGMRGIIPATILSRLNSILKDKNSPFPLYSYFDLVVGTSTGGIIAASITSSTDLTELPKEEREDAQVKGFVKTGFFKKEEKVFGTIKAEVDPDTLAGLYTKHGSTIFTPKGKFFGKIFSDKYDEMILEGFLRRIYKDEKMGDLLVPTAIVTYDTKEGEVVSIKSWDDESVFVRDALRATSAAPLYFSPAKIKDNDGKTVSLIDGGVAANNPALLSYKMAKELYPNCKKFHVLSLATAVPKYSFDTAEITGGYTSWAEPIMKIYSHTQLALVDEIAESITDMEYIRVDGSFTKEKIKMDDTSHETIALLRNGANTVADQNQEKLEYFANHLIEKKKF